VAGQRIGYVRVSTLDQNERRQLDGQVLDRVFTDKASGRDTSRPELTELLRFARDGDTVVVHSMDRTATLTTCAPWFKSSPAKAYAWERIRRSRLQRRLTSRRICGSLATDHLSILLSPSWATSSTTGANRLSIHLYFHERSAEELPLFYLVHWHAGKAFFFNLFLSRTPWSLVGNRAAAGRQRSLGEHSCQAAAGPL
jgi:hypothetical protein